MKYLATLAVIALAGCASPAQMQQEEQSKAAAESRVVEAAKGAITACMTREQCDKAFTLAKVYVQRHSDMKVQFSDNATIFTYNPYDGGQIGMRATRVPVNSRAEILKLEVTCKGLWRQSAYFTDCARRVIPAYNGFVPYITSQY